MQRHEVKTSKVKAPNYISHPYKLKRIDINAGNVNHMHAPCRSNSNQPKKLNCSSQRHCWPNQPHTLKEKRESKTAHITDESSIHKAAHPTKSLKQQGARRQPKTASKSRTAE